MGLTRIYGFRDKRRFRLKIAIFSHPRIFDVSAERVSTLEFCKGAFAQKLEGCRTRRSKKFDDMFIRLDTIPRSGHRRTELVNGIAFWMPCMLRAITKCCLFSALRF